MWRYGVRATTAGVLRRNIEKYKYFFVYSQTQRLDLTKMSAPVLSAQERKKSLSSLKKKAARKNVLTIPSFVNSLFLEVPASRISQMTAALEKLLPGARLFNSNKRGVKKGAESDVSNVSNLNGKNKAKRQQLLVGVNAVSKAAKKDHAACVVFADDIHPKLLIRHLAALCSMKNIPYVLMPKFRQLTMKTLGFSCIVLGFKKTSTDFLSVIELIKTCNRELKEASYDAEAVKEKIKCEDTKEVSSDLVSDVQKVEDIKVDGMNGVDISSVACVNGSQEEKNNAQEVLKHEPEEIDIDDALSKAENCEPRQNTSELTSDDNESEACTSRESQLKFSYLYRDSTDKRVFVPKSDHEKQHDKPAESPKFIPLGCDADFWVGQTEKRDEEEEEEEEEEDKSEETSDKSKSSKSTSEILSKGKLLKKMTKERKAKNLMTGKKGIGKPVVYQPWHVLKMGSNPDRDKFKFHKIKLK